MNKLTKGAIATAAGVILLMGGAGTFATWNAQVGVTGQTITAGNLALSAGTGTWSSSISGAISNIGIYRIVPGDTLTFTQPVTLTAVGHNLTATVAVDPTSVVAASSSTADTALKSFITSSATVAISGSGITQSGSTITVTGSDAGVAPSATITVSIPFSKSATGGAENGAKLGSVKLNDFNVTVTQQ
jgi:alternate signal-mediated exported protein